MVGVWAGIAIVEQLIQRIFALFEGSDVLENFASAMETALVSAAPLIGVLLQALTPAIVALTPAIEPLARAITPLVELLGIGLLGAVLLLTPAITLAANGIEKVTSFIRDATLNTIDFVIRQLNRLPFVDIQFDVNALAGSFDRAAASIRNVSDAADRESERVVARSRISDGQQRQIAPVSGQSDFSPVDVSVFVGIDGKEVASEITRQQQRSRLFDGE